MNYLENRNEEIKALHKIYSDEIPEFLYKYLETPEVMRLSNIGQNCGVEYVGIKEIKSKYFYSRLDHSFGVALIIWNFTKSKKQTIAGFFHDISSPVFAHVIDFLKNDHLTQEATEKATKMIIESSEEIKKCLIEDDLSIDEVCDYKLYSIADNKAPRLSADRLEYTFNMQLTINTKWDIVEIKNIYNNIEILQNEENDEELGFNEKKVAIKFTEGSLRNSNLMVSNEDKYAMQFLAKIVELLIINNETTEENLYRLTECEIIKIIECSKSEKIRDAWKHYTNMTEVKTSETMISNKYCVQLQVKKRYIDVLIRNEGRISKIDKDVERKIEELRNINEDNYVYTEFNF